MASEDRLAASLACLALTPSKGRRTIAPPEKGRLQRRSQRLDAAKRWGRIECKAPVAQLDRASAF